MLIIFLLLLLFAGYGVAEYALHRRNLRDIPVRVQVNGTRGKSSVTRLIAAGLRAGGIPAVAKTTGTLPRFITGDSDERPVRRLGKPNIAEQLRMVRMAREAGARALVFENMSLDPQYQRIESRMLVRPTDYVVTNVRADHLDVMGPTVRDIALTFRSAMPRTARVWSGEPRFREELSRPGSEVVRVDPASVSDEEMQGFGYVEHRENVALALAVCAGQGVERGAALAGMKRTLPDSGALRIHSLGRGGRRIELVNALAANDPDSIGMIWRLVSPRYPLRAVLVNCRADRQERSRQLAELVAGWEAERYIATGGLTRVFIQRLRRLGVSPDRVLDLGDERPVAGVVGRVFELAGTGKPLMLFCCGNTVGYGRELTDRFVGETSGSGH
ncbi:poly-gamma-glutamate synthase PgsB [candidate division WOR-3 bacterium]|nr:poly-gamma-glutamate synthase PgsB [candidate division WOR-3 bacterium]